MRPRRKRAVFTLCALLLGALEQSPSAAAGDAPKSVDSAAQAEPLPPEVQPLHLGLAELRNALQGAAPLAALAPAFVPFGDADADAALRRGGHSRGHVQPYVVLPTALAWRPEPGTLLWVISGRSGERALLAVLRVSGSRVEHAASMSVEEADSSIALEFTQQFPKQLSWSTCHGCAGEGGAIRLGEGGRVEITYR